MTRTQAIIAAMTLALSVSAARAETRIDQAKQQVKAADIDYRLGRFAEALEEYTRAYELYPVAPLLFNIGQCHRHLKGHAKAIFFFEGYLRDAPTASNRALVDDLIREAKAELDKEAATAMPAPSPAVPASPTPAADELPPPPSAIGDAPHDTGPGRPRLVPSLLIGGGAAALGGGGVLYYFGQKRGSDEKFVYDDTRWLGGAVIGVGGAAVIAGAILWVRRPSSSRSADSLRGSTPVAAVGPGGGYVGWAGVF